MFYHSKIVESEKVASNIFFLTVEIKCYNIMTDGKNFFDQQVKYDLRTDDKTEKMAIDQGDDYTTSCLLDYPYFKKYYKLQ